MEDAALAPPGLLERAVERLLPVPARECVMGDLREVYRDPWQYLGEALRTVPRVAASYAWRNANLPALGLNGALIWLCLAGLKAGGQGLGTATMMLVTAAGIFVLILSQMYGDAGRPTGPRAIKGAIWTVALVVVLCVWNFGLKYQRIGGGDSLLEFGMLQSLPFVLPILGLLRTGLLLQSDFQAERLADDDPSGVEDECRAFSASTRRANWIESGALIAGACLSPALAGPGLWLPTIFFATAAFLLAQNIVRPAEGASLRARYRRQLQTRRQLRHFLSWLWAAPFLLAACRLLVWPGYESGRAILVALGSSAIVSICFLARAADSECAGLLRERMERLEMGVQ